MNTENAIVLEGISKSYPLYSSPMDRMKEALSPFKKTFHKDFFALKNINLAIPRGGTYGIIGLNGSGKSTLLKIICQVARPSTGTIATNGQISALLELGAGFNPEFTGRQNVYVSGALAGLTRSQVTQKLPEIEAFADIGDFIDQPVKNYSSGMLVRLAFSVAVSQDPDILIVDEALSVGDARFQHKCLAKMQEFKEKATILFVTHDMNAVVAFCDKAIWLHNGEIVRTGDPKQVAEMYTEASYEGVRDADKFKETDAKEPQKPAASQDAGLEKPKSDSLETFGRGNARISEFGVFVDQARGTAVVNTGAEVEIRMNILAIKDVERPLAGFIVKNNQGVQVFAGNTDIFEHPMPPMAAGTTRQVSFTFPWPKVGGGTYSIALAIADGTMDSHVQEHWIHNIHILECVLRRNFPGIIGLEQYRVEHKDK